ncbi:MAG: response regulator [Myxococcales bacterium]|nr:response regulator [Myxococcales bacterium]
MALLRRLLEVTAAVPLPDTVARADRARRERLFLMLTTVVVAVTLAIVGGVGYDAGKGTFWVYIGGVALVVANAVWRRMGGSLPATSNVLVAVVFTVLTGVTLGTGGVGLPAPFGLAIVPMLAILLGGLRASLFWTIMAIGVLVLLTVLHARDFNFPIVIDQQSLQKRFLVGMAGIVVLLCALALLFDWLSRAALRDLSLVHADLDDAREQAQEANRTKTRFLANMSHEIRTPMNGVLNMLDLLRDGPLSEGQRRSVDVAYRSAQALLHLLNDIVDLAKVEAGALALEARPFSLHRSVREVIEFFALSASGKGLRLSFEPGEDAPDGLIGDAFRLRQVLINLVGNAIKFTTKGGIRVRVSSNARGETVLKVVDSGIGIASDQVERIFDPFTQADASSTRRHGGTGLGLAISRQLVEQMGGTLRAESALGTGSTFIVTLPLPRVDEVPEPETTLVTRTVFPGARVLVVEDNPVNRMVAEKLLARLQVNIESAVDGRQGIDAALAGHFDLVLMDCQMPEVDGYEATRHLREVGYTRPIVALTANAMEGDRERCLDAGMDDFLAKPLRKDALLAALDRWLPKSTRAGQAAAEAASDAIAEEATA